MNPNERVSLSTWRIGNLEGRNNSLGEEQIDSLFVLLKEILSHVFAG